MGGLLPAGFPNLRRLRTHSGFLFAIVCDARTLQGALALRPNHTGTFTFTGPEGDSGTDRSLNAGGGGAHLAVGSKF